MTQKYFLVFVLLFAFFVGLYSIQTNPGFWFDEGIFAQMAKNIALDGVYGIQIAPGQFYMNDFRITTGYPVIYPSALSMKFFGISIWSARLVPFTYLLLFIAISYLFIKKLYGFKYAALASLLLVTFPPLYGNGKAVLGELPGLFWLVFGALLFLLYEENKKKSFLAGSAMALGLCVATKPYYALIVPGVIFLVLYLWFKRDNFNYRQATLFSLFFSLPILVWVYFSFSPFSFQNFGATFSFLVNPYGVESFNPLINLLRFVSESTPIHFTVLAVIVFLNWFISQKNKINTLPIVPFLLIFISFAFLWYLKMPPGWYRYFFPIHILVILLFPYALFSIFDKAGSFFQKKHLLFFGQPLVISLFIFQAVFLFVNYNEFYGPDAPEVGKYTNTNIPRSASVFVFSKPEIAFLLENENLYQYINITNDFKLGENYTNYLLVDYIIAATSDEQFLSESPILFAKNYNIKNDIGRYRIYQRKDVVNFSSP